jgi:hypothetical protein
MVGKIGGLFLCSALLASGSAAAAPCPDVVGDWRFELQCVRASPTWLGLRVLTGVGTRG